MAETIVVQRGNIGTHNMHIHPDHVPTGMWASIEAQNAGIVAGNWQSHIVCTPYSEEVVTSGLWSSFNYEQINNWNIRWPRLGSYTRLAFRSVAPDWWGSTDYVVRLWNDSHSATFYDATVVLTHNSNDYTERIVFEWDMEGADLSSWLNKYISIQLLARPTEDQSLPGGWLIKVREFSMYTANRPL